MITPDQFLREHWHFALILLGICVWISLSMIATLWIKHSKASLYKKLTWTILLLIPGVGWILYLGIFQTPSPNKLGESAPVSEYFGGGHHL
jgi:hypothetical protein